MAQRVPSHADGRMDKLQGKPKVGRAGHVCHLYPEVCVVTECVSLYPESQTLKDKVRASSWV